MEVPFKPDPFFSQRGGVGAQLRKLTERLESQRRLREHVAAITAELRNAAR